MQAVLLLCLLAGHLLRTVFAGSAAMTLRTVLPAAAVMGALAMWFAWAAEPCCRVGWCAAALQWSLAALLALDGTATALNLGRFCKFAYGSDAAMLYAAAMAMVPLLFLKKKTSLAGAGTVVLFALCAAAAAFGVVIFGRLRVQNLQFAPQERAALRQALAQALKEQLVLYPEYLLPAFWYTDKRQRRRGAAVLPLWNLGALALLYLVLEMLFGADLANRLNPFYSASALGAISVFERMEWGMLMIGTAAVSIKLALYMVSVFRIMKKEQALKESARYPLLTAAVLLLLGAALRGIELEILFQWLNWLLWGMVILVCLAGTFVHFGRRARGPRC